MGTDVENTPEATGKVEQGRGTKSPLEDVSGPSRGACQETLKMTADLSGSIDELQLLNEAMKTGGESTNRLVGINIQNVDKAVKDILDEAGPGVSLELQEEAKAAQAVMADAIDRINS